MKQSNKISIDTIIEDLTSLRSTLLNKGYELLQNDVEVYMDAFLALQKDEENLPLETSIGVAENLCDGLVAYMRIFMMDKTPCDVVIEDTLALKNVLLGAKLAV